MKPVLALIGLLAIIAIAYAWKKDRLNKLLPDKLKHHESFIGLNRDGQYITARGGGRGIPGTDLNTSAYL